MRAMAIVLALAVAGTAAAQTVRMRGPSGQTVDVEHSARDYYEGRGFRVLAPSEEMQEIVAEADRRRQEREDAERWQTIAVCASAVLLGWIFLYLVRKRLTGGRR